MEIKPDAAQEEAPAPARDKRVLIVEDDESMRDFMTMIVSREGFQTRAVGDGAQALRGVEDFAPDLILLDLMLPGPGGYEIVRELQGTGHGGIPVLIVSARHMDEKTVELLKREPNVRDFVAKPPRPAPMAARIHGLLKTRPSP